MNDPLPPLTDDDLSAHLDGEAGPDVAARISADPDAATRLEQLRAAATAVRDSTPTPLAPDLVDDLVARALGAPSPTASPDGGPTEPGDPVVAPLPARRPGQAQWLVAAVILVLVAVGLALVYSGTRGTTVDDTATSAGMERSADDAGSAEEFDGLPSHGAGGEATTDADGAASPTTTAAGAAGGDESAQLPDLGAFDSSEALRTSLALAFPTDATSGTASAATGPITEANVDRCASLLVEVLPVTGDPRQVGVARVSGETVLVYEFEATPDEGSSTTTVPGAPATTLTTAVRPAACDPLFVFQR